MPFGDSNWTLRHEDHTMIQGKLAVGLYIAALVLLSSVSAEDVDKQDLEGATLSEFLVLGQPFKLVGIILNTV